MLTTKSIVGKCETTVTLWISALEKYSEEDFARKPDADSWSIGQVYNHLVGGTDRYHLKQITLCLKGEGEEMSGGKKLPGKICFFIGSFLPVRIKVPSSEAYTPKQPLSLGEMRDGLKDLILKLRDTEALLAHARENIKTVHPAFGMLNAREWFQLIEMHFRHHLRQKARLDEFLGLK